MAHVWYDIIEDHVISKETDTNQPVISEGKLGQLIQSANYIVCQLQFTQGYKKMPEPVTASSLLYFCLQPLNECN